MGLLWLQFGILVFCAPVFFISTLKIEIFCTQVIGVAWDYVGPYCAARTLRGSHVVGIAPHGFRADWQTVFSADALGLQGP